MYIKYIMHIRYIYIRIYIYMYKTQAPRGLRRFFESYLSKQQIKFYHVSMDASEVFDVCLRHSQNHGTQAKSGEVRGGKRCPLSLGRSPSIETHSLRFSFESSPSSTRDIEFTRPWQLLGASTKNILFVWGGVCCSTFSCKMNRFRHPVGCSRASNCERGNEQVDT